jgi:hypothetical protein
MPPYKESLDAIRLTTLAVLLYYCHHVDHKKVKSTNFAEEY